MPIAATDAARDRRAATTTDLITLVIVDDHVALRRGTELLLGRRGHVIAGSADDAAEGYALIRSRRPDVAVIDLGLPGENGARLTRRLLAEDPDLAILIYTGVEDQRQIDEALDCGARGFALKAGPPEELVAAIRALADGGTYMDPRLSSSMLAHTTTDRIHELSTREREILGLLAQGLTGAQAAKQLWLSPETVRTHVRNAMTKLEARTRSRGRPGAEAEGDLPRGRARRRSGRGAAARLGTPPHARSVGRSEMDGRSSVPTL